MIPQMWLEGMAGLLQLVINAFILPPTAKLGLANAQVLRKIYMEFLGGQANLLWQGKREKCLPPLMVSISPSGIREPMLACML